jgi:hypothetical protein
VAVNGPQDLQKRRQKQIEMAAMQQHITKASPLSITNTQTNIPGGDIRPTPHTPKSMGNRCPNP